MTLPNDVNLFRFPQVSRVAFGFWQSLARASISPSFG